MKKSNFYLGKGKMLKSYYTVYDKCIIDCEKMRICESMNEIGDIYNFLEYFPYEQSHYNMFRNFFRKSDKLLKDCFEWLELQVEVLKNENNVFRNNIYIGGNVQIGETRKSSFPLGIIKKDDDEILDSLVEKAYLIKKWSNKVKKIYGKRFYVDPYSTSILLHELIGHYSEKQNDLKYTIIKRLYNIEVHDEPKMIIDYNIDDLGKYGKTVDIKKEYLNSESGNVFIGKDNNQIVCKQIRQRNLNIVNIKDESNINEDIPKLFICRAGVNLEKKIIAMIVKDGKDVKQIIIPIEDIEAIIGKSGEMFQYTNVCIKQQVPHYIGYNSIWSMLYLKKDINFYMQYK